MAGSKIGAPRRAFRAIAAWPQLAAMMSSRSPCSPLAASVHLPARPRPSPTHDSEQVEAAARRIPDVADKPVAAFAAAVGEIVAADGFGIVGEAARQFTRLDFPCGAPSKALRPRRCRSKGDRRSARTARHRQPCQRVERDFVTNGTSESSMTCLHVRRWDLRNRRRQSQLDHGGHYRSAGYNGGCRVSGRHERTITPVVVHFLRPERHLEIIIADPALLEHPGPQVPGDRRPPQPKASPCPRPRSDHKPTSSWTEGSRSITSCDASSSSMASSNCSQWTTSSVSRGPC